MRSDAIEQDHRVEQERLMHTHTHMCVCITYTHVYIHVYICVYVHVYVCIYIYIYICIYPYIYTYIRICVCIHIHNIIYTYMYMCIYVYIERHRIVYLALKVQKGEAQVSCWAHRKGTHEVWYVFMRMGPKDPEGVSRMPTPCGPKMSGAWASEMCWPEHERFMRWYGPLLPMSSLAMP